MHFHGLILPIQGSRLTLCGMTRHLHYFFACWTFLALFAACSPNPTSTQAPAHLTHVKLAEYEYALRNPMKCFACGQVELHPYSTIVKTYIPWQAIERFPEDSLQTLLDYCDLRWREGATTRSFPGIDPRSTFHKLGYVPEGYQAQGRPAEQLGIKLVPRIILQFSPIAMEFRFDEHLESRESDLYWPQGLETYDYSSPAFQERLKRLVPKLAKAWDNDPRVAHVEMGIIGLWGEQHTPFATAEVEQLLGDLFAEHFTNKHVLIRWPHLFPDHDFGVYADSWGHISDEGYDVALLGDRWKTRPITGEVAYNWGQVQVQPGVSPDSSLILKRHRDHLVSSIRTLHCSYLFWIGNYSYQDTATWAGADELQKALGYRYVIDSANFTSQIEPGRPLQVGFLVTNQGSAPFYYQWPVEVALLDLATGKAVWTTHMDTDIRTWLPGNFWNPNFNQYMSPPQHYRCFQEFALPEGLPAKAYHLALSINDPAGNMPALRFANQSQLPGCRLYLGTVTHSQASTGKTAIPIFIDPAKDTTLSYVGL